MSQKHLYFGDCDLIVAAILVDDLDYPIHRGHCRRPLQCRLDDLSTEEPHGFQEVLMISAISDHLCS